MTSGERKEKYYLYLCFTKNCHLFKMFYVYMWCSIYNVWFIVHAGIFSVAQATAGQDLWCMSE